MSNLQRTLNTIRRLRENRAIYGPDSKISLSRTRRVIIDVAQSPRDLHRLHEEMSGCYFLYHVRLVENRDFPLAKEFIQIFRRGSELRFILWNQNEREKAAEFHGTVTLFGRTIWLIGVANGTEKRLRVMLFRDTRAEDIKYRRVRWGIMSTDIPRPTTPDPTSCRVLLYGTGLDRSVDTASAAEYAKRKVQNYSAEACLVDPVKTIFRLVSNNTSAASKPFSLDPLSEAGAVTDSVLKVSQETAERFCEIVEAEFRD